VIGILVGVWMRLDEGPRNSVCKSNWIGKEFLSKTFITRYVDLVTGCSVYYCNICNQMNLNKNREVICKKDWYK